MFAIPAIGLISASLSTSVTAAPALGQSGAHQTTKHAFALAGTVNAGSSVGASSSPASGPSTAFMTQLISQNNTAQEDERVAYASTLAGFAPAPHYNSFVDDSIVKYLPSDAGLPSRFTPASASGTNDAPGNIATQSAYSATQSRNFSNLSASVSQLAIAG